MIVSGWRYVDIASPTVSIKKCRKCLAKTFGI